MRFSKRQLYGIGLAKLLSQRNMNANVREPGKRQRSPTLDALSGFGTVFALPR
jgi:hypothetical protein